MFAFILRFVEFLILVSVIRSVLRAVQRLFGSSSRTPPPVARTQSGPQAPATVLQQDPVCGTYVAIDTSLKKIVDGKVLHFCSEECRARYAG